MQRRQLLLSLALMGGAAGLVAPAATKASAPTPRIELVTDSDYQWTGVAVSKEGRGFVTFPTLVEFPSFHVGELKAGVAAPLLDRETNQSFANLSGIFIDAHDRLWVLDSGKLEGLRSTPERAKLVSIDLRRNMVSRTYPIPARLLTPESDLADLRIDVERNRAYISDGGAGGILVIDLRSADVWIGLDRHVAQTRANARFIALPSRNYIPAQPNVNGMTLSEDGSLLYFTPMIETRLYAIPAEMLANKKLTSDERRRSITTVAENLRPSAGMVERNGIIYMGDLQGSRIMAVDLATRKTSFIPYVHMIHWADDFAKDSKGDIWFTESENCCPVSRRYRYRLYRMRW